MNSTTQHHSKTIDFGRVEQNIAQILTDSRFDGIAFRPHFKTHRSEAVGELFRKAGVGKITVASLPMAKYFAANGWDDILIAIPANPALANKYDELAGKINLSLLIDCRYSLTLLLQTLKNPIRFCIKADAGYGRAGIEAEKHASFLELIQMVEDSKKHRFGGIISHFGNTYHASSDQEIKDINLSSLSKLKSLKSFVESETGNACFLSIGDTPSLPYYTSEMLAGVNELRAGNFVYYDMMQVALGTCRIENIAMAFKTTVLSVYSSRNEALVHAGAVHLSKEKCLMPDGKAGYGAVVRLLPNGCIGEVVQNCFVDRISQEHGILRCSQEFFNEFSLGSTIGILPVHSCLVVEPESF
jgi:D-serine deaminase-like pyridoxal phosphate-dependent protein